MVSPPTTYACCNVLVIARSTTDPRTVTTTLVPATIPEPFMRAVLFIEDQIFRPVSTYAVRNIEPLANQVRFPIVRTYALPEIVSYGRVPDPINVSPVPRISCTVTPEIGVDVVFAYEMM